MLELYIKVVDGQPMGHPILKENLLQAFPGIDLDATTEYVKFERVAEPALSVYDAYNTLEYKLVDGVYKDVWTTTSLTAEEKLNKQNDVKLMWESDPDSFKSWIFDENLCGFVPPIPYPVTADGVDHYVWNEDIINWVLVTGNAQIS